MSKMFFRLYTLMIPALTSNDIFLVSARDEAIDNLEVVHNGMTGDCVVADYQFLNFNFL